MTIRAALTPPSSPPQAASPAEQAAVVQTAFGVIVGGTPAGDMIVLSPRAIALRAGAFVKALVIAGLTSLRASVALAGGRTLVLEDGFYRVW